jgi:hypothetical protein
VVVVVGGVVVVDSTVVVVDDTLEVVVDSAVEVVVVGSGCVVVVVPGPGGAGVTHAVSATEMASPVIQADDTLIFMASPIRPPTDAPSAESRRSAS